MNGPLEWIAAIGTIIAAGLVAADLGRKVTGAGFVLFCAVALMWVVSGLASHAVPIAAMNAILLLINAWGVWQYLLNPRTKKVIERVEKAAERIERQVETEEA
jgi:Flp pilus assembly protein TadB